MIGRIFRGSTEVGLKKVRLGVAAAVLVGGGAAGVAAVAANSQNTAPNAQPAALAMGYSHNMTVQASLSRALSMWSTSRSSAMNTLAHMQTMRTYTEAQFNQTTIAAQRGVVLAATPQFLYVQSADGARHLWWLNANTQFVNVTNSVSGMVAMMGNNQAASGAMNHNMSMATSWMAGGASKMWQMTHETKTMVVHTGSKMVDITPTGGMNKVTMGAPAKRPHMPAPKPSMTTMVPAGMTVNGVAQGDFVFVVGVRQNGQLMAKLVLFVAPMMTPTGSASASTSMSTPPTSAAASSSAATSAAPSSSAPTSPNPSTSAPTSPAPSSSAPTSGAPASSTPAPTGSTCAPGSMATCFNTHF